MLGVRHASKAGIDLPARPELCYTLGFHMKVRIARRGGEEFFGADKGELHGADSTRTFPCAQNRAFAGGGGVVDYAP